jgi:hypothetical protein
MALPVRQWTSPVLREIWRRNEAVRVALLAEVDALSEAQAAFKPAPPAWSIGEILDHLCLSERSISRTVSRIFQQAAGLGLVQDAGATGEAALPMLDEARYSEPAGAPESVMPSPERPLERLLAGLEESRERLLEVSARADGRAVGRLTMQHFQLGELDFYQWLLVEGAHERKHLDQILRLKGHPEFPER